MRLNFMSVGFGTDAYTQFHPTAPPSATQLESVSRFFFDVDDFLADYVQTMAGRDWKTMLSEKRFSYEGEVEAKARELTIKQVLPCLPPAGVTGSVPSISVAPPFLEE